MKASMCLMSPSSNNSTTNAWRARLTDVNVLKMALECYSSLLSDIQKQVRTDCADTLMAMLEDNGDLGADEDSATLTELCH